MYVITMLFVSLQPGRDASGAAVALFRAHMHHPSLSSHQTTLQVCKTISINVSHFPNNFVTDDIVPREGSHLKESISVYFEINQFRDKGCHLTHFSFVWMTKQTQPLFLCNWR